MSIKFGLTEKERILQLAREEDDEPCIPSTSEPTTETAVLQAACKKGPQFFQSIDITLRPIAPFIRVRPKLPRTIRQKVLDKLTGQHLALEAVLNYAGGGGTDSTTESLSPSSVAADSLMVQRSVAAAVEQEADIYERCSSAQVYQNLASRCTALDWRKEVRAAAEAEKAYEKLLAVQRSEDKEKEKQEEEEEEKRQRKRSKMEDSRVITEADNIDGRDKAKRSGNTNPNTTTTATATATKNSKTYEKQQNPLLESDLDWDHAKPDISDDIHRQKLRKRVIQALESCPKWKVLTVDERIATVERCVLKIVGSSDIIDPKSIEDTAVHRLAMQYIDFMIKKRKV